MIDKEKKVKRFQWMRNAEGGQQFGNWMEIRLLDETAFEKYILPKLQSGLAESLAEYQMKVSNATHYAVIWRDGDSDWQFIGVGSLDELQKQPESTMWAREVEEFDLPEVIAFGNSADRDLNVRKR